MESSARTWPRLYLDTAEILRIGDRKSDASLVAELTEAMWAARVILVISIEHLQDAIARVDGATIHRTADAIEQFRLRCVVTTSPSEVEPFRDQPGDIDIAFAANIREVLTSPERATPISALSDVQAAAHDANILFQQAQRDTVQTELSRSDTEFALQCLVTLIHGWRGSDVDDVMDFWIQKHDLRLSTAVRNAIHRKLQAAAHLLSRARADGHLTDNGRQAIATTMRDAFDKASHEHSPGRFLAARLATCRTKNLTRIPSSSDLIDVLHVMYFPYVDIATCDRQTYACLEPHVPRITRPRRPTIIRNGNLRAVLDAVQLLSSENGK